MGLGAHLAERHQDQRGRPARGGHQPQLDREAVPSVNAAPQRGDAEDGSAKTERDKQKCPYTLPDPVQSLLGRRPRRKGRARFCGAVSWGSH